MDTTQTWYMISKRNTVFQGQFREGVVVSVLRSAGTVDVYWWDTKATETYSKAKAEALGLLFVA